MGIVRNLVVRFKNWYKDLANNVVNNMNTRELTDDVKLRDNSKGKRPVAGLVALVLMATPVLGLTENSEVELTTETKIENQVKDIPLGEETDEAVVNMLATPTDEMSDEEQQLISYYGKQITSVEDFKKRVETAKGESVTLAKTIAPLNYAADQYFNWNSYHCLLIADELIEKGIISSYGNSVFGETENESVIDVYVLEDALKNDSVTLRGWFYSDEEFEEFNKYWLSIKEFLKEANKNPKKANSDLLKEALNIIKEKYNNANDKTKIRQICSFMMGQISNVLQKSKSTKYIKLIDKMIDDMFQGKIVINNDTYELPDGTILDVNDDRDITKFLSAVYLECSKIVIPHMMNYENIDEQYRKATDDIKQKLTEAMIIVASDGVIEETKSSANVK